MGNQLEIDIINIIAMSYLLPVAIYFIFCLIKKYLRGGKK